MCFFDGETPVFISVDDIQFVKPVTIGAVMEFSSTIVYSQDLFIVVQVMFTNMMSDNDDL
jgi:acyl-CoA hydrolase